MQTATTSAPLILRFTEITGADLALVGGKAANLGELTDVDFPVPLGFCVTVHGFQQFLSDCHNHDELFAALDGVTPSEVEQARQVGQRVRQSLASVPIPSDVAQAIVYAWQDVGSDCSYAVRSSATAEDLPNASFAGQQDTFLNVSGERSLLESVRDCWISLFTDRAILYRARNGFPHRGVYLAVIIQKMVNAEVSGIMFTADPGTGRRHIVAIDASFGLGEALVGGLVTADHYQVDKRTFEVASTSIAEKKLAISPRQGGGTVQGELGAAKRASSSISEEQAVKLARMGAQIEEHFQAPQDIEWAIEGGQIAILQSRPITSLFPLPPAALRMARATDELQLTVSFGAVQGMLDPLTRLGQDAIKGMFAGAATLFGYKGVTVESQHVIWGAAERLFINFTAIARHPIGRRAFTAFMQMVEPVVVEAMLAIRDDPRLVPGPGWLNVGTLSRFGRLVVPMFISFLRAIRRPDKRREQFQVKLDTMVADIEQRCARAHSLGEVVVVLEYVLATGFTQLLPVFVPMLGAGMASLNLLRLLADSLPDNPTNALLLTRGLPHNVTSEMDLELWKTAETIRQEETYIAEFLLRSGSALADDYLNGQLSPRVQSTISQFLDRYGFRAVGEIDIGRPRWCEDPTHIIRVLQSYLRLTDPAEAPDAVFAKGAADAESAAAALVGAVRVSRAGWFKARLAKGAIRRMRALIGIRESPKFLMMQLFGLVRTGMLNTAEEFVRDGVLDKAEDLFFLELAEIRSLASGEDRDWKGLVIERRRLYEREMKRRLIPRLLLSDGHAFYDGIGGGAEGERGDLVGSPVSPGVAEGRARVVFDPLESRLEPGDILVCRGTDPAWTPLFLAAAGLVMEVGGLMTHGSVVAREYGIPAVVGVHEATTRVCDGEHIRVDGTTGVVYTLQELQ